VKKNRSESFHKQLKDNTFFDYSGDTKRQRAHSEEIEVLPDEVQPEYLKQTMKKKWRWIMLALCCSFVVSNYFCYDNPAALET